MPGPLDVLIPGAAAATDAAATGAPPVADVVSEAKPTPLKDLWTSKVAPGLAKMQGGGSGVAQAYQRKRRDPEDPGPLSEDPRGVVAAYNLGDLVKMYSA